MSRGDRQPLVHALLAAVIWVTATSSQAQTTQNPDTFTLSPTGYIQLDLRGFPDWGLTPGEGRMARDTVELRRARVGVDGTWRRIGFEVSIDPQDVDGTFVKDAYGQVRFSPRLRVRAGQFKVPGTRDYGTSARDLDLLERIPLTSSLGVGRDIGARVDGRVARVSYDVGMFAGDGVGRDDRAGFATAGRVNLDLPHGLEIGGAMSGARTRAHDSDPANGPAISSSSGYRFADGVYVQGLRLRLGADLQWTPGRWRIVAEGLRLHDDRHEQGLDHEDLPAAIGTGFSTTIVRRLRTRQDRAGNPLANALLRRPLDVAFRYDYISFDDTGASGIDSVRPRATNIRARASHGLTLGSTWSVGPWMRILGNIGVEHYSDARSAPEPGRSGPYLTLGARLQLQLP